MILYYLFVWLLGMFSFLILTIFVHEAGHYLGVRKYYKGKPRIGIDRKGPYVLIPSWFSNKQTLEVLEMGVVLGTIIPIFYFVCLFDPVGFLIIYYLYIKGIGSDLKQIKFIREQEVVDKE